MASYEVKKVKDGPYKGKWGVYSGSTLLVAFERKSDASRDANRRKRGE